MSAEYCCGQTRTPIDGLHYFWCADYKRPDAFAFNGRGAPYRSSIQHAIAGAVASWDASMMLHMRFPHWLNFQESLHPRQIVITSGDDRLIDLSEWMGPARLHLYARVDVRVPEDGCELRGIEAHGPGRLLARIIW